jgi:ubiquitin-protein ligase
MIRKSVNEWMQCEKGNDTVHLSNFKYFSIPFLDIYPKIDDNKLHLWQAIIFGPDDTEWEGAVFHLNIEIGNNYPNEPPKIKFVHPKKMFHPNVY